MTLPQGPPDPSASTMNLPEELTGGKATSFSIGVESVTLKGGSQVKLAASGVTAVVGANNVGKSTLLREIFSVMSLYAGQPPIVTRLVEDVKITRTGSGIDLVAWLADHATYTSRGGQEGFVRMGSQSPMPSRQLAATWEPADTSSHLGFTYPFMVHYADAQQRLGYSMGTGQRADIADAPSHPLHYLQDDPSLLVQVDELSKTVFGVGITLDRLSGQVQLRIGHSAVQVPTVEAVTSEYRAALSSLPVLAEQGDGMRSFLGLMLPLITATCPIVIVDEPEAFLHPPQAAALGRALAAAARESGLQVVVATHDKNFLTGLLDADVDVSIVRLSRTANTTTAFQLDDESLRGVWNDPVLRYGNLLDGLFHRRVVLAEGDSDCRFYAAALEAANEESATTPPPSEVLFVPCGGKDGMSKIAKALNAVRVSIVASPDLDILDDGAKVKLLVEKLGGDWEKYALDYKVATEPFRVPRSVVLTHHIASAIAAVLKPHLDLPYTPELRAKVKSALRVGESPWKALKDYGQLAFKGQAAAAAERLLTSLDELGLVAVRVGVLENFAPTLGVSKGAAWLPAALEAGAHKLAPTQLHVRRLIGDGSDEQASVKGG